MEDSVIGAADIHRLIGRAKAAAPDPSRFSAQHRLRQYGDLAVESVVTGALRVTSTPPMRKDLPAMVLFHVVRGGLSASHRGREFVVAAGESVLLLSSGQYDFRLAEGEGLQVRLPLRLFAPGVIADILAAIDTPSPPSVLNSTVWTAVRSLVDAPERDTPDAVMDQALESLVAGLLTQVATQIGRSGRPVGMKSPLLAAALLYLDNNLADSVLDLDTMAEALHTSPRTLHREFRAIGTSPMAALRDARLTAIAERLNSRSPLPALDELAQEYGYSDRTALTRAFHRRFGRSPAEHRSRVLAFAG